MAIAAVDLGEVAQIDGVLKAGFGHGCQVHSTLNLAEYRVAGIALLGQHLAVRADMLAIVTAEAAIEVEMPDVVGMGLPVQLHLRKRCLPVDALQFSNRVANLEGFVLA